MSAWEENCSENEDDPQVYESSGDEWSSASEKKRNSRRPSQRLTKKPRVTEIESTDSESDTPQIKGRNGVNKRQKVSGQTKSSTKKNSSSGSSIVPAGQYMNGSFLILKKDVQTGDTSKHPCIWRIDGKALLQKYEPFEDDGKIKHKNTSIYTGWSALDKDLYAPITVTVHTHSQQQMIVELDWQQIKQIKDMDSD